LITGNGYADVAVRNDSGQIVRTIAGAVSPDGKLVAVLTDKIGMPQLYDVATGRQILSFHGIQGGLSMSWSPDGSILAIACKDGYVDVLGRAPVKARAAHNIRWDLDRGCMLAICFGSDTPTRTSR